MQPDETKPPLRFRKSRIAWSVFWGLACVLLIVLWVRSYRWTEIVILPISSSCSFELGHTPGTYGIGIITSAQPPQFIQLPIEDSAQPRDPQLPSPIWGKFVSTGGESVAFVPAWF